MLIPVSHQLAMLDTGTEALLASLTDRMIDV